jgi:hypothetical protein
MLGRHKLLILIPAILLIPILLGVTPLNMAHRLASGGPFTHCKQAQWSNHCPFHSLISHDDLTSVTLNSIKFVQESMTSFDFQAWASNFVHSNISFYSVPLRC